MTYLVSAEKLTAIKTNSYFELDSQCEQKYKSALRRNSHLKRLKYEVLYVTVLNNFKFSWRDKARLKNACPRTHHFQFP